MSMHEIPSMEQKSQAVWAIADIANELNEHRGVGDSKYVDADHLKYARAAVNAVSGIPVVGSTSQSKYYGFRLPIYEQHTMGKPPMFGNRFEGIIRRVVNAPVRNVDNVTWKQVCLQIAPLAQAVEPDWVDYYAERGWDARLQHPFGDASKAGKSVWIPLGSIGQYQVQLPNQPEAAQYSLPPVPAWRTPRFE